MKVVDNNLSQADLIRQSNPEPLEKVYESKVKEQAQVKQEEKEYE